MSWPVETYDTHERLPESEELTALDAGGPVAAALVYSAKGAACLARLVSPRAGTIFRSTAFICISPRVARELGRCRKRECDCGGNAGRRRHV